MMRVALSSLLGFALLGLVACAETSPPVSSPATAEASIADCPESRAKACDNGAPLCAVDEDRACRVCVCSNFAIVPPALADRAFTPNTRGAEHPVFADVLTR